MIAADYAMAWNEDIDGIGTYGLCHGSYAVGMVELERDCFVAFRLPGWYFKQWGPYLFLSLRAYGLQRDAE